jgi:hypothetical protein
MDDWGLHGRPACAQGSICSELVRRLAEHGPSLARAVALAAEVDCLASLASVARERSYARPLLTQDNVLHIKQGGPSHARVKASQIRHTAALSHVLLWSYHAGRHLLTEMVADAYIPNDTAMRADSGRVQVITGPNFSGGDQAASHCPDTLCPACAQRAAMLRDLHDLRPGDCAWCAQAGLALLAACRPPSPVECLV